MRLAPLAEDLNETMARLRVDAKENANLTARAVKGALGTKLASFKAHGFKAGDAQLRLPGYRILQRIGSGGMSSIYLASRESDGELLVLKILAAPPEAAEQMARFVREYTLLSTRLQHCSWLPGVISIGEVMRFCQFSFL